MKSLSPIALAAVVFAMTMSSLQADCGNRSCCLCGKKVCVLKVTEEEEDVTYFDVEAKEICIPGIKLPWECKRRCGGVRKVCVLKEEKRSETVCKYDWSIKVICTSCCKRHGLQHGTNCAKVQKDEQVPFEYYTADLDKTDVRLAAANVTATQPTPPLGLIGNTTAVRPVQEEPIRTIREAAAKLQITPVVIR